jgi:hypothetical protein
MPKSTFATNPVSLESLLTSCDNGEIQLPDFQRGWVWTEDRIQSLIVSVRTPFPGGRANDAGLLTPTQWACFRDDLLRAPQPRPRTQRACAVAA